MKTIKAEYYSKSYYDNLHKKDYRYEIAWYSQPLIHMGDINTELRERVFVNLYVDSIDFDSVMPSIDTNKLFFITLIGNRG